MRDHGKTGRAHLGLAIATCLWSFAALAQPHREPAPPAHAAPDATATEAQPDDPAKLEARRHYEQGAMLVRQSRWAEALEAFERSARLRPHPVTSHNVGACLRAMGRYAMARKALALALQQHESGAVGPLPEAVLTETRAFLDEIDRILARVVIHLEPASASIAVDGRPLEADPSPRGRQVLVAGVLPPGRGARAPGADFDVLLDPGPHVISLSRPGYRDSIVNRTLDPGSVTRLDLVIERLPATLLVDANQPGAVVRVDGADVGLAPTTVVRPGGSYRVAVVKPGYVPYESQATVGAGEQLRIRATLREETPALTSRWWFWGAVSTVVAGTIVGTYYATRPEPTRPPPDGGSLGWVIVTP